MCVEERLDGGETWGGRVLEERKEGLKGEKRKKAGERKGFGGRKNVMNKCVKRKRYEQARNEHRKKQVNR